MKKYIIYLYLLIAIILFSIHSVAMRYLIIDLEMSAWLVFFLRFFIWWLFLAIIASIFFWKKDYKKIINKKTNILKDKIFWINSISLFFTSFLFILALKFTSASNWMLLATMSPVLVVIFSMIFIKNSNITRSQNRKIFFIAVITAIGSSLLFNDYSFNQNKLKLLWDTLAFLSAIALAITDIYNVELRRKYSKCNWVHITSLTLLVTWIISIPFLLLYYDNLFPLTNIKLYLIILISIFSTWIGYLLWFIIAKRFSAIFLSVITNILWITTIFSEYLIYNRVEPITINLIIGSLLIISWWIYIHQITTKKIK